MSYSIVYSSRTGNTALLAQAIREALPQEECSYFGAPHAEALGADTIADTIYVGFWTDKGTCDEQTAHFLQSLTNQKVFLFGTAGFGGAPAYFEQILGRVKENLASGVQVVGTYMCQGKMPQKVRQKYESMKNDQNAGQMDMYIHNFDEAITHPDSLDVEHAKVFVEKVLKKLESQP